VLHFLLLCFTLCPFVTQKGSNFDLDQDCSFNQSSDFCPRMAKEGICWCVIGFILLDKITSM
jgi:hypothetical protein